jgi:pectate lyase
MKSTGASSRSVTVKYKKAGDPAFTTLTPALIVQTAASFNLTTLYPIIATSGALSIRIEPTNGNIQVHDVYVLSQNALSPAAEITAFKIPGQIGNEVINSTAGTIAINVPTGTTLNPLAPQTVSISALASINPLVNATQNFSAPVNYTVTAQNGTTKNWVVTVTQVSSTAKEITDFKLSNTQIGTSSINSSAGTITVNMPIGSVLTSVVPTVLTISPNASISPSASTPLDFSAPIVYTVTAQDNSTKSFTVTVNLIDPNLVFTDFEAEEASFTGTVDNNHLGYTGTGFINFLAAGENSLIFTVCEQTAGNRTAKFRYSLANDTYRKGNLYVNDVFVQLLNFPRTITFDDWLDETVTVNLNSGLNTIKILWDTTDGPNIDKMQLSGAICNSYLLNVTATNGGVITKSPARNNNRYYEGETVTLSAQSIPSIQFNNWTGDITGNTSPTTITMNANKTIVGNFSTIPTYTLNYNIVGIGGVTLSPAGGVYAQNTVVTVTANSILGSTFTNWGGNLTGNNPVQTITMNSNKNVTATFNSAYVVDFEQVKGFASITADGFTGPTKGGQCAPDTLVINGPSEFNLLCEALYYRQQAYRTNATVNGMKKAPLVIILKAGIYDGSQALSTNGAKIYGNFMMDIPEQGDLTFLGESNVVYKIGINVKRSWNILIRNITFYDYYDDGINIGYPETHHIWIDHCTIGHPVSLPTNIDHPDGGCDVKDGASYVTISWCLFRNSWKTSLNGHSDNNGATDLGRLKITYVNNLFQNTNSRNPRVRFGQVHVLNNLFDRVLLYGSVAANTAQIFAEKNFYLNTDWPMYADRSVADFKLVYGNNADNVYTSKTGNYPCTGLKQEGNEYDDSGLPVITDQINPAMLNPGGRSIKFDELNPASVFTPSTFYTYTPMTAQEVKVITPLFAGADKVVFANCSTVVPLSLLNFTGTFTNNIVPLQWQTNNEINTKSFEIEKSLNAVDFKKIGTVSTNNSLATNNYKFDDTQITDKVNYYRLKMIDNDGRFTYSKIITITVSKVMPIIIYPNVVSNILSIKHTSVSKAISLNIYNANGQKLLTFSTKMNSNTTEQNIASLVAGLYFVVVDNDGEKTVYKFIKQ